MTEQETRRSDEEIAKESASNAYHFGTADLFHGRVEPIHVIRYGQASVLCAAPELKKQANLKLLNEIKNEVKERFQDRTRLGETATNHEDRLADAAYLNALSGLWDWLEAKRRELEK